MAGNKNDDFYVVGLAASGLGIGEIEKFFSQFKVAANAAIIVATHQKRDRESLIATIIDRSTFLPVHKVDSNCLLQPGHVYVIVEHTYLYVEDRYLKVTPRPDEVGNRAIDYLFVSLGREYRQRAVGIVFWGMGTDSLEGVLEIERNGGLVIVQQPDQSAHSQMPQAAIIYDHPHLILPGNQIADRLQKYLAGDKTPEDYR